MAIEGECTLADLARGCMSASRQSPNWSRNSFPKTSSPTAARSKPAADAGQNIFGLTHSAIYFAGIEVSRDQIVMVITDLHNNIIQLEHEQDFILDDTEECLDKIGSSIDRFINDSKIDRSKLLGIGICIAGRVNRKPDAATNISPRAKSR